MEEVNITITEESSRKVSTGVVHTIMDGRTKYEFWENKKNGDMTKAYEQFLAQELSVGTTATAGVDMKAEEFTNDKGKLIQFTRRTILYWAKPREEDVAVQEHMDNAAESDSEPNTTHVERGTTLPESDIAGKVKEDRDYKEKGDILWEERDGNQ